MKRRVQRIWPGVSILAGCAWLAAAESRSSVTAGEPELRGSFSIETWDSEDGLPQGSVTALIQSRDGYIWAGTYNGLARFDGVRFVVFDSANTPALENSRVTSLFADSGTIWIGHETGHLSRLAAGRFQSIPLGVNWPGGPVIAIGADQNEDIYLLSQRGALLRLRDQKRIAPSHGTGEEAVGITSLVRQAQGQLWVTWDDMAARLENDRLVVRTHDSSQPQQGHYSRVSPAPDGGFWALSEGHLRKHGGQQWTRTPPLLPFPDSVVTAMLETGSQRLLVGSLDHGLLVFDGKGHSFQLTRTNGLPHDWVRCLMQDREGNIWVATNDGLCVLRPRKVKMHSPPDDWQGRRVLSITQAGNGAVWAGTEGAGIYRFDGDGWTHFGGAEGVSNLFVWSVMEENSGRIWAGTWGGGLFRLDNGRFSIPDELAGLREPVTALKESSPGTIWIGTGEGLARFSDGRLERFAALGGPAAGDVRALHYAGDGTLWLGASGAGLGQLRDRTLTTFTRHDGLASDFILSLHFDDEGTLWLGTLDQGICRFRNGRFSTINMEHGLPNNAIIHIAEDGSGNLWLNSHRGLFRVSKAELHRVADGAGARLDLIGYGREEGMTTTTGSGGFTPSGFRSPDGRLWFPTGKGIAVIHPAEVRRNMIPPPVLIEEVFIDGEPAFAGDLSSGGPPVLKVPPGRRPLEIRFTALSFASPQRVRFKYRLQGLEPDWNDASGQRAVTYSYLPPGDYRFQVIACNSDGIWNETGDALALAILPFYWQTWWFKTIGLLLGLTAVGGGVFFDARRRMHLKLDRLARERELERERGRIAQDIHDDLGASLTRIGMLGQSAKEELHDPSRTEHKLAQICDTARELTRAMDEIVWAVNPRHDHLDSLVNYLTRFAHDFLSAAQTRCRLDAPLHLPDWHVRSEIRHNLFLAFKEALHNIVKHAAATEVRVALSLHASGFTLTVTDNGHGFGPNPGCETQTPGDRCSPGNGLDNMNSRLEQIGGACRVRSVPCQGTTVQFSIPLPHSIHTGN